MQIETLKIFCDLVESKSFSQAAEANFVTQVGCEPAGARA
jgi:DNA-binding transcriptional LysR family regulator